MSIDPSSSNDTAKIRMDEIPLHRSATPRAGQDSPDVELIDETKNQIRALVQEIGDLAKSDCSEEEFYRGFLTRTTSALASIGGVIWTRPNETTPLKLLYHINLKQTPLANDSSAQLQHSLLLEQIIQSPEPTIIPPNSGGDLTKAGNPTNHLLLFGHLILDGKVVGVAEIFQRVGGGPATQRGYLRFLSQMCEIANDFLKTRRLRSFNEQQQLWTEMDQFSRAIHHSLDTQQTAYIVVNEGRRIVGCDRVSLAVRQGQQFQVIAVSGLDTFERRADQIKRLSQLANTVCRGHESLWFSGDDSKLAPQIETQLHAYLDVSHAKFLGILPLFQPEADATSQLKRQPIAALILEQLTNSQVSKQLEIRSQLVSEHSEAALANALEHNSIFLMPVWKNLGWISKLFGRAALPKTAAIISLIAAVILGLCVIPYPFTLGSTGELIAERQQEVFAQIDGRLTDILVPDDPNKIVEVGQPLATMQNNNVAVEIEKLEGKIKQVRKQIDKYEIERTNPRQELTPIELLRVDGASEEALVEESYLKRELEHWQEEARKLTIRSPIRGRVVNWQLRRNLLGRPVEFGDNLMTVISPDTSWQIELFVPENRMGHLLSQQKNSKQPMTVTFTLASSPGKQFSGTIERIDQTLDVYDDEENSGRVLVNFPNNQIPNELLRPGTRATAKIHCGKRSVGYVLFHELFDTIKSTVLFWF